ncbi:hypothetical protein AgCh_034648 [Apium graveolens]
MVSYYSMRSLRVAIIHNKESAWDDHNHPPWLLHLTLHNCCTHRIIRHAIKASNVLLAPYYEPPRKPGLHICHKT